jgi:hypothetical protein
MPSSPLEQNALAGIAARTSRLADYLARTRTPSQDSPIGDWLSFLSGMKAIVGNSDNDVSLVATILARDWLCAQLPMRWFDAVAKAQNAPGLDVDEQTASGERVVGELKTTEPYKVTDFGSAQIDSIRKDFVKLNAAEAAHRFFFVTTRRAFDILSRKYSSEIPQVTIVLLPSGETHRHGGAALPQGAPASVDPTRPMNADPSSLTLGSRSSVQRFTLQETYREQGFFNVGVLHNPFVRERNGEVLLVLVNGEREERITATVNRKATGNGTARIMGGRRLRDWFRATGSVGTKLEIDFSKGDEIRISRKL